MSRKSKPPGKPRKSRKKTPVAGSPERTSDPALEAERPSDPAVAPIPLEGTQPVETAAIVAAASATDSKPSPSAEPAETLVDLRERSRRSGDDRRKETRAAEPEPVADKPAAEVAAEATVADGNDAAAATPTASTTDQTAARKTTDGADSAADTPAADQLAADKADKAAADQATVDKATTATADEPAADKTAVDKVAAGELAADKATANEPAADKATADKAAAGKLAADQAPATVETGAADPATGNRQQATGNRQSPVTAVADEQRLTTEDKAVGKPVADMASTGQAAADQPAADKTIASKAAVANEPAADKAADQPAAADKVAADKAAAVKPAVADQLAASKAAADKPTVTDKPAAADLPATDAQDGPTVRTPISALPGNEGPTLRTPITELRDAAARGAETERRSGEDRRASSGAGAPVAALGEPTPFVTDPEAATLPAPEPISAVQVPAVTLDPGMAAMEAARIAGEIVGDISTASGAAIVAAAAAGAAIEAARQQQAAGISTVAPQAAGAAAAAAVAAATTAAATEGKAPPASDGSTGDPVTTVRMQRERILRALADDLAVNPALGEARDPLTSSQANAPLARGAGPPPAEPAEARAPVDGEDDELDPVQIAAAAIQKLRHRASTNFTELRGHYHRHDLLVLLAALIIIVVAGRVHTDLVTPPTVKFPEHSQDQEAIARGLTFEHSAAWLKAEKLPPWPPRIARDPTGQPPKANDAYYAALTSSVDPNARIEILIDKRPAWTNIVTGLELDRRTRWGELYTLDASTVEEIGDQNWLRTAYRYAHAPEKGDVPRVDRAIEYATVDREQIYVVTLFGLERDLARIESVVAPTLRVPQKPGSRSALPLVPQTRGATHRSYPDPVAKAFDSTVMVVVADLIDGRLIARGGGSGVIVGADGSILTNYHVVHDKNGRLHDVFVIGRFGQLDQAPQLQCAGRPNRSKLQRELDLALIKCDTDLDGRTWTPGNVGIWQTLAPAKPTDVGIGQRLWVLGFPDVGGGGLTLSTGEIGGWTGQDGAAGRDFIKTDASITHGNSGGPAVDDKGRLVGIATASRTKISQSGGVIETKQVGLVRPLGTAADLLAIAAIGWTPREGHTDVDIQPSAVEAPAEGIRIATHVVDHSNEAPVRDALVMVVRPGIDKDSIDVNRLDDQVIAWGRSNTQGEVQLKQPVPRGTYTVLVRASGYQPLIGESALVLDEQSPANLDPWGGIRLRPL